MAGIAVQPVMYKLTDLNFADAKFKSCKYIIRRHYKLMHNNSVCCY